MKQQPCWISPFHKGLTFLFALITITTFLILPAIQCNAKEFNDDLTTDFYGGTEDNITIRQNLKGSLQLAPYAILGNWISVNAPSSTSLYLSASTVYNGKVYLTGGFGSTESSGDNNLDTAINRAWYATILSDGKVEEWKEVDEGSRLPQPTYGHTTIVINGRIYIIGGSNTPDKTAINSVYWAKIIGHDGSIKADYATNTWTAVATLPTPLFRAAAAKYEGRIYIVGGIDLSNTAQNIVYYADVQPDGDIITWNTASALLPTNVAGHAMVQTNGRLYVIGGSNTGEQINSIPSVFIGDIDQTTGDVTNWTTGTSLPEALFGAAASISAGKVWVSGGIVSGTAKSLVYYARIDRTTGLIPAAGQVDTWTRTTDLPVPIYNHNMVSFNNQLFITGGYNAGSTDKFYSCKLITNKTNITKWEPTTSLFISPYAEGSLKTWTGHTAILRVPLQEESSFSSGAPVVFVIGGGANDYSAFADGAFAGGSLPEAYSTVYNSEVDSNGSLKTWAAPDTGGSIPVALTMHMSTLCNGWMYVIGGANSLNATIFADAPSVSINGIGYVPAAVPGADPGAYGETYVYYEQVQQGGSGNGAGSFEKTGPIPVFDPAYEFDTYGTVRGVVPGGGDPYPATIADRGPIYQPLIRAGIASYNGYIYVIGGISRENNTWNNGAGVDDDDPITSMRYFEDRVWYCRPNPGGSINDFGGPGGWKNTTPLASTVNAPTLEALYDVEACVAYGRLYIFGGRAVAGTPRSNVYYAEINDDGSLGAWVEDTSMLIALAGHQVVFTSGRFYVIGGADGPNSFRDDVYYCTPMANVTPLTASIPVVPNPGYWELSQTHLERGVTEHKCVSYNGYIYLLGGRYTNLTVPISDHTSSAYYSNISDMYHTQNLIYSWAGNYERYIDLSKDQLIENITWDGLPNNETIRFKYRTAMEKSMWSDWSLEQAIGPMDINRFARYVQYKIHMETLTNDPSSFAITPEISRVILNYAASKKIDEDNFQINHNKFDPQVEQLLVTYKTRDHSVDGVVIRVYNLEGEMVRKEEIDIPATTLLPATGSWQWDGTNSNAELVANGVYIIQYNSGNTHKIRRVLVFKK